MRRARVVLVGAVVVSVLALVVWFPAGALVHQRSAIAATDAQLAHVHQQNRALADEAKRLGTPQEIERLARQHYGLVLPGQRAYQVLPPSSGATAGSSGTSYAGDPANQPLVDPTAGDAGAGGAVAGAGSGAGAAGTADGGAGGAGGAGASGTRTASGGGGGSPSGFLGRIEDTLEFWR